MGYTGKRKWICLECKEVTYFSASEIARSGFRCSFCPSRTGEPSKASKAKGEIIQAATNISHAADIASGSIAVEGHRRKKH
jgi:hypothetical protein